MKVTKKMVKAGQNVASYCYDASVETALNDECDLAKYPFEYHDLLEKFINGDIDSVEVIYKAMWMARKERG
jgi:hypothetical protein